MIWKNWNKADKTLLTAGVVFLFALCLSIQYKGNVFAAGFLFCAEAALVGGIADWFAVTALFEKPLGFPWHTAILPRRRQAFINATGRMLQKEFFGKKALIAKIKKVDFSAKALAWLKQEDNRQRVALWLEARVLNLLQDNRELLSAPLKHVQGVTVTRELVQPFVSAGMRGISRMAGQPEFRDKVRGMLEQYVDSKLQGPMAMMMAGFAQSMNLLNLEEASQMVQERVLLILEKAAQENTGEYHQLNESLDKLLTFLEKNECIKQDFNGVVLNCISNLKPGKYAGVMGAFSGSGEFGSQLEQLCRELVDRLCDLLAEDKQLQQEINGLVYQFAARAVLQGQELLGSIADSVLGTMTDEQINRLVYDKAEPDLLWIRMNGSIVGAFIGLVLFVLLQLIG